MGLQFLHGALLWGLGLVLLPVLIHLLRRRLARRHRLPTFEFLLRTQRRITSRSRLRNWVLLALRVSAIALVVLLASRPLLETEGGVSGGAWSPLHLVVVLDNSASMGYATGAGSRFEVARRAAAEMIRGLSPADRATVLATVASGKGEKGPPAALPPRDALARLEAIGPTDAHGDGAGALRRAMEALGAPADRRSVVVLSDFARGDWEGIGLLGLRRFYPNAQLQFVRVAPEAGEDDVFVKGVTVRPWPPRAGAPFAVAVRVVNRTKERKAALPVSLFLGGARVASAELDLGPGAEEAVSFRVRAPEEGALLGRVELGADAWAATNRYFFAAEMGRRLRVLVVDGDPRRGLQDSETFFVASALRAAAPGGDSPIVARVVAGYELGRVNWDDYQAVVACNVGAWPPEAAGALRAFVEAGGGLFLASGAAAGSGLPGAGWLPAAPGAPRAVRPALGAALTPEGTGHPAFALLGGQAERFFRQIRVRTLAPLTPVRGGKVLLSLADGTPLLVAGAAGAGKVMVWGSTCDREWTDLPVRPVFVPFVRGLADFLGGRAKGGALSLEAGQPLELRLPARREGEGVRIRRPGGGEVTLRLRAEKKALPGASGPGAAVVRFPGTFRQGFYRAATPEGEEVAAVNVPARESDTLPVSDGFLRGRVPGAEVAIRRLRAADAARTNPAVGWTDLGVWLFLALAAVFVAEGVVADRS